MSSDNSPPPSPNTTRRRASFSPGQAFSGLFSRSSNAGQSAPTNALPSPIASAANNTQQRRSMSITTLGLSTSPTQPSPFARPMNRRSSFSSSGSGSPQIDEEAVEEGDGSVPQNTPATPFGRRLSFGAQALRDVRTSSSGTNGRRSISSASTSIPEDKTTVSAKNTPNPNSSSKSSNGSWKTGEGLNWGEQLRARARAPSFGSASTNPPAEQRPLPRTQKVPGMDVKDRPPPKRGAPDHIGEKMLRGDFYMD
jgi:hypothetical protein